MRGIHIACLSSVGGFIAGIAMVVSCSSSPADSDDGELLTVTVGGTSLSMNDTSASASDLEETCSKWRITKIQMQGTSMDMEPGWYPFAVYPISPAPILLRKCVD